MSTEVTAANSVRGYVKAPVRPVLTLVSEPSSDRFGLWQVQVCRHLVYCGILFTHKIKSSELPCGALALCESVRSGLGAHAFD